MLCLILNKREYDPYIDKNTIINPFIQNDNIIDQYENYSELYKEIIHHNLKDDIFYIIGIIFSLLGIWYFTTEINKSVNHSE